MRQDSIPRDSVIRQGANGLAFQQLADLAVELSSEISDGMRGIVVYRQPQRTNVTEPANDLSGHALTGPVGSSSNFAHGV